VQRVQSQVQEARYCSDAQNKPKHTITTIGGRTKGLPGLRGAQTADGSMYHVERRGFYIVLEVWVVVSLLRKWRKQDRVQPIVVSILHHACGSGQPRSGRLPRRVLRRARGKTNRGLFGRISHWKKFLIVASNKIKMEHGSLKQRIQPSYLTGVCVTSNTSGRRDFARKVRDENPIGFTLLCLKGLDLLDLSAKVKGCESCYLTDHPVIPLTAAAALDGYCDAMFEQEVTLDSYEDSDMMIDFIERASQKITDDIAYFAAVHPDKSIFTICTPVALETGVTKSDSSHANAMITRVSWMTREISWTLYEPHGNQTERYKKVSGVCAAAIDRVADMIDERLEIKLMMTSHLRTPSLGLQSFDRDTQKQHISGSKEVKGWLVEHVYERKSFVSARAAVIENLFGITGGNCSAFTMMMCCLGALYPEMEVAMLEYDIYKLMAVTSKVKAPVSDKDSLETYKKYLHKLDNVPREIIQLMSHGTSAAIRAFSLSFVKFIKNYPDYECCEAPNGKMWVTLNGKWVAKHS